MVDLISTSDALRELERLTALDRLSVMNSRSERELDAMVKLAARVAGTKSAGISLVDDRRQLFKARHDIPFAETPREMSFCAHAMTSAARLIIPDARRDKRFADNPLVTSEGGIRFYAGFPLTLESGHCVGALCVFDPAVREGLDDQQVSLLNNLANVVTDLLETSRFRQLGEIAARVLDTSTDAALCVNEQGLITFWSRGAEAMFGHLAKEAIGQNLDLFLAKSFTARLHTGFTAATGYSNWAWARSRWLCAARRIPQRRPGSTRSSPNIDATGSPKHSCAMSASTGRLDASMGAFRQTMTVQAQVVENIQSDTEALADIVARSQGAEGSLQGHRSSSPSPSPRIGRTPSTTLCRDLRPSLRA